LFSFALVPFFFYSTAGYTHREKERDTRDLTHWRFSKEEGENLGLSSGLRGRKAAGQRMAEQGWEEVCCTFLLFSWVEPWGTESFPDLVFSFSGWSKWRATEKVNGRREKEEENFSKPKGSFWFVKNNDCSFLPL